MIGRRPRVFDPPPYRLADAPNPILLPRSREMADTGKLIEIRPRTGAYYEIPTWGFLEAIEIRFTPPLPNMDSACPHKLILEVVAGPLAAPGAPRPQVFARVRDVRGASAGAGR